MNLELEAYEGELRELRQRKQDDLIKQGWRQCAVGQRTTQYCGMAEQARLEEREACAKRDWQGLTDEQIYEHEWWDEETAYAVNKFLMEKNT